MNKQDDDRKIWGWAIYDWANSAFATTVMAGFFPVFFKQHWSYGEDTVNSTAVLGLGNSLASLCVAILAPLIGAVADAGSSKKRFLMVFAYSGALSTALLYWIPMGKQVWAICLYGLGVICFSLANVSYDALLITVSNMKNRSRISSLGYALGYLGGGTLFLCNVLMSLHPHWFGLSSPAEAIKTSFMTVSLWWGGFSLISLCWLPSDTAIAFSRWRQTVQNSIRQLIFTIKQVARHKNTRLFLVCYWCYMDGVDTIIRMAIDYGLSIGFESRDLILALLMVQFIGFPAALAFGSLSRKIGERNAIITAISGYAIATLWGCVMVNKNDFYFLAGMIGCVQGGIQAISRSYFARFIPIGQEAGYYGLMNMTGKMAAIAGPALLACVGLLSRTLLMPANPIPEQVIQINQLSSRIGMGSLLLLFAAGIIMLSKVKEPTDTRPR